jgi:GTPase SAR1 family protein
MVGDFAVGKTSLVSHVCQTFSDKSNKNPGPEHRLGLMVIRGLLVFM